jgi:hypothetical protein
MQQNFGSRSGKKKHKTNDGGSSLIGDKTFFLFSNSSPKNSCLSIYSLFVYNNNITSIGTHAAR